MPLFDRARKAWKKVEAWAEEDEQRPAPSDPAPALSEPAAEMSSTPQPGPTPDAASTKTDSPTMMPCCTDANPTVTSPYTYTPLSADIKGQIRLLTLLPGQPSAHIQCLINIVDLKDAERGPPDFEALSYVWGDTSPESNTLIQIDNGILAVGRNLRSALLHLRHEDEPRTLWVDAVCINQESFEERGLQVPMMGEIYRTARRAIVWLGCASCLISLEGPGLRMRRRNELTKNVGSVITLFKAIHLLEQQAAAVAKEGRQIVPRDSKEYRAMVKLAPKWDLMWDNPWWSRVWTLQEIVLARDAVIHMSREQVAWEGFRTAVAHHKALGLSEFYEAWGGNTIVGGLEPLERIIQIKQARESVLAVRGDIGDELLYYLASSHWRASTVPHDKIYGVLGLFGNDRKVGIDISYRFDPADVFTATTRALLEQSGNLDALGFCYPYRPPSDVQPTNDIPKLPSWDELPSWVPNWGSPRNLAAPLMNDARGKPRTTHASRGSRSAPRWEDGGKTLVLQGHIVDTITKLGSVKLATLYDDVNEGSMDALFKDPVFMAGVKDFEDTSHHLELEAESQTPPDHLTRRVLSAQWKGFKLLAPQWKKVLSAMVDDVVRHKETYIEWQGLIASELQGTSSPPPRDVFRETISTCTPFPGGETESRQHFDKWMKEISLTRNMKGLKMDRVLSGTFKFVNLATVFWMASEEEEAFAKYTSQAARRRLGFTQSGRVCLLPSRTELGDKIALVQGGRVPLVVRARGDAESRELIGEAFVNGIMDGEAFSDARCADVKIV